MNRTFETVGEKYPLCDCDEYAARIDELESSCAERKNTAEEEFNSTNEKLRQNSAMRSAAESVNKALSAWEEAKAKMEQLDSRREEFDGKREQLKRYELAAEAAPALEARNKLSNSLTGFGAGLPLRSPRRNRRPKNLPPPKRGRSRRIRLPRSASPVNR